MGLTHTLLRAALRSMTGGTAFASFLLKKRINKWSVLRQTIVFLALKRKDGHAQEAPNKASKPTPRMLDPNTKIIPLSLKIHPPL